MYSPTLSIVILGATGAVGGQVLKELLSLSNIKQISLLGRRSVPGISATHVQQHTINVLDPASYINLLSGHDIAICTLGVGQPSKVSKEYFLKIDKAAVLEFGKACKDAGVKHFELLSSVGISANSSSFYLRTKGELVEELKALQFERLSIFQPSMILTPQNRYGWSQGVLLKAWPLLKPLLPGGLKPYRGVKVDTLGRAIAQNIFRDKQGIEYLKWQDFHDLAD